MLCRMCVRSRLPVVLALLVGTFLPAAASALAAASLNEGMPTSHVQILKQPNGGFQYLVDGRAQTFIGMGYNPIYRNLLDHERIANYERDFQILHDAGVNTITGWDADKGYEQDKFDELTLAVAEEQGLGVVMPLNLPPEGDYNDAAFVQGLMDEARAKAARFKYFTALRMWGLGNEVFWDMPPDMYPAFQRAYIRIADLFHELDPDHPVIYREAEDRYVSEFATLVHGDGKDRPWLQYGMNIYNKDPKALLARWPSNGLDRPLFVSEFGAEATTPEGRAVGYAEMWQSIRCFPKWVMGGAPYAWTVDGPEPTDKIWGLMDGNSNPLDETFEVLRQAWLGAQGPGPSCQSNEPSSVLAPATAPPVRRVQAIAPVPAPTSAPKPVAAPAPSPAASPKASTSIATRTSTSTTTVSRPISRKHH